MKSVQAYISAQVAVRSQQQASGGRSASAGVRDCNYDNDYYGDRVCVSRS